VWMTKRNRGSRCRTASRDRAHAELRERGGFFARILESRVKKGETRTSTLPAQTAEESVPQFEAAISVVRPVY